MKSAEVIERTMRLPEAMDEFKGIAKEVLRYDVLPPSAYDAAWRVLDCLPNEFWFTNAELPSVLAVGFCKSACQWMSVTEHPYSPRSLSVRQFKTKTAFLEEVIKYLVFTIVLESYFGPFPTVDKALEAHFSWKT